MSECVVRMEMPTLEKGCKIAIGNEYMFCQIEARWCNFYELGGKCPSWCPILCQLPEGHGRLVDADQLIHETHLELVEISMNGLKGTPAYADDLRMMCKRLADEDIAPTIVPAERSET